MPDCYTFDYDKQELVESAIEAARPALRQEVALAASCVEVGTFDEPTTRGQAWKYGVVVASDLRGPQALEVLAHEHTHWSLANNGCIPDPTPHHCPVFFGLNLGLQRRWLGRYLGDRAYDFADRPFLISQSHALRIAARCAQRAERLGVEVAARVSWRDILLIEIAWRIGAFLERSAGALLFVSACLLLVAIAWAAGGDLAAVEMAFFLFVAGISALYTWPHLLDVSLVLNQQRSHDRV